MMVGNTPDAHLQALIHSYEQRLAHLVPFAEVVLPGAPSLPALGQKQKEGAQLIAKLRPGDVAVLLDERGSEYTSRGLAEFINKQAVSGAKRLVFIIGGAYGFSEEVYRAVPLRCSLSKLTFPHDLVRLIAAEQLYRAFAILNHLPYHHD